MVILLKFFLKMDSLVLMISQILALLSCRRCSLEKQLADADVSEEEVNNILKQFEKKETEYMRLQRHKMSVDDFDLLTMIGKGAFGEVNQYANRQPFCIVSHYIYFIRMFLVNAMVFF